MEFRIAWMFPDTLFLHGERGNILALKRYAGELGMEPVIDLIDFDTKNFDPLSYDLIFFGPGEIAVFEDVLSWLKPYEAALRSFVESGRPMLVTGTTIAMFSEKVERSDGSAFDGMGIVPAVAHENEMVYGDDIWCDCSYNGKRFEILGQQIQMMDMIVNADKMDGASASNFGELKYGYGNTGKDRCEGFLIHNSVFTSTLGPLLVCNPWLTVEMIRVAASSKGEELKGVSLSREISFDLEEKSLESKKKFIQDKKTELTNCR